MTNRLTKGMYGHEFGSTSDLFGIRCGQMRGGELVHNGGWYNRLGEKLGWGDLSIEDMQRIASQLEEGELFIILGERDSYWDIHEEKGDQKKDEHAPGVEYVTKKCRYIIAPKQLYAADEFGNVTEPVKRQLDGMEFTWLPREMVNRLIATGSIN